MAQTSRSLQFMRQTLFSTRGQMGWILLSGRNNHIWMKKTMLRLPHCRTTMCWQSLGYSFLVSLQNSWRLKEVQVLISCFLFTWLDNWNRISFCMASSEGTACCTSLIAWRNYIHLEGTCRCQRAAWLFQPEARLFIGKTY